MCVFFVVQAFFEKPFHPVIDISLHKFYKGGLASLRSSSACDLLAGDWMVFPPPLGGCL